MENQKNNKGVIALLIVIIVILSVLCILFATGTISFNSNEINNDINNDTNQNNNTNNQTNQNVDENNEQEDTNKNLYDVNDLNVDALDEYQVFDNISNNANVFETLRVGDKYFADLDITGKVTVKTYTNEESITGDLNVNNVIDIIVFEVSAPETEQLLYLLTDNGDVYWYKLGDVDNKKFIATKVDTISNVEKLFISRFTKENAGGSHALFAITKSNDCVMLRGESV